MLASSVRAVLYCLFRGAIRDTRKSAHCLRCAGHAPVGLSKRGRDTESDANIQPEEMLTFFSNEYSICISTWNPEVVFLSNITYRPKERYAYSGNSFENKIWIFPLTNGETSSIIIYASRRRTISYCQIRTLEKYSSGRRGAPAKGIGRVNRREGSNPSFSALFEDMSCSIFFLKKLLTCASIHDIMNELSRKISNTDNNGFWKRSKRK